MGWGKGREKGWGMRVGKEEEEERYSTLPEYTANIPK